MYLAASPPLFVSPLMGPLDVSSANRRPFAQRSRHFHHSLEFDFSAMTLSPVLVRAATTMSDSFGRRTVRPSSSTSALASASSIVATPKSPAPAATTPLRSCLVIRTEVTDSVSSPETLSRSESADDVPDQRSESPVTSDTEEPTSPTSRSAKKRVVFADAKGLSLTQVKMMTEPSDCPPRWTAEFLEQVTGGASAEVGADRWELAFAQPASDYLEFRSKLERQNVSLENVVVQDADQQLVGTVKVRNLSYSKHVTVRATFDNWQSHTDVEAAFVPSGLQGPSQQQSGSISLFDTFSFKIQIPGQVSSNRIQFCVRFTCDAGEFWDNNVGRNYVIVKPVLEPAKNKMAAFNATTRALANRPIAANKYSDIISRHGAKVDYWSDFASWNHLVNDSPYW